MSERPWSRRPLRENDHLAWCEERLAELDSRPSVLAPIWYAGSFFIGAAAGIAGDKWSLGFVAETEKQVVDHLDDHLQRLPDDDERSRAIIDQMRIDELRHGSTAVAAGGAELPGPVRKTDGFSFQNNDERRLQNLNSELIPIGLRDLLLALRASLY